MNAKQDKLISEQQTYLDMVTAAHPYRRVSMFDRMNANDELFRLLDRCAQLEAERDNARNELIQIGELITLDPGESVYHGIQTMIDALIGDIDTLRAERDALHADIVQCVSDARKMAEDLYRAQNERDAERKALEALRTLYDHLLDAYNASISSAAKAYAERDEQKQRADILEHACEKALNERDHWKHRYALLEHVHADLRNIRGLLKPPEYLNTFDAVGAIMRERDELRRQLEQAQEKMDWIISHDPEVEP